jgi:histidinol-phosphate aminotransferase
MNSGCDMLRLAAPGIRDLHPYQPGKPISELEREYGVSDIVKLASNENPLGASPAALRAMQAEMQDLALYPDGGGYALKQVLAKRHGITADRITLGNGSNDVLVLLAEAFLTPGLEAVYSQYCFAVYPIAVQAVGAGARLAPAHGGSAAQPLGHDLQAMQALLGPTTRMVFIANPNNPTGTWLLESELRAFLQAVPENVLVVVDEAYHEYARDRGVPDATLWLDEFPNLVVTRTFSKAFGLAGIRVGYALSSPQVSDILNRIRPPFNVNSLALAGAAAALGDTDFIERSVASNREGVRDLSRSLQELGLRTNPSAANFVLVDLGQASEPAYRFLLGRGIIVRPVSNYGLPTHLRITVGTASQNRLVIAALAAFLEGSDAA